MKMLSCKDMGSMDCDFVAEGDTAEATVTMMMEHAAQNHPDKVAEMSKTMSHEDMMSMMMSKVKDR